MIQNVLLYRNSVLYLRAHLQAKHIVEGYSIVYQRHAVERMALRAIREEDIEHVLHTGESIEVYAHDTPYPSELLLGWSGTRPLHVVVATDMINRRRIIITAYQPDPNQWDATFRGRRS